GARPFEGISPNLKRRYEETNSDYIRERIAELMSHTPCPVCQGTRLRPEARVVTVAGVTLPQLSDWPVSRLLPWVQALMDEQGQGPTLSARDYAIAERPLREIRDRLSFLVNVGLDYLSLSRNAATLSGGEAQRIRLATQVGSRLTGVLYVLDEPSIGLHPRDTARLIRTLLDMRDLGNTVLVVEHDEDTIRAADWIVDLGPGAGEHGGEVVVSGPLEEVLRHPTSLTGAYLSGRRRVPVPTQRRPGNGKALVIRGARHHNLKNVNVRLALGQLICVTGVSGSGKSSLVVETLYARLAQMLYNSRQPAGECDAIEGLASID
ncbi:MAG: excinuclease ABC subunit UvrA, partial [Blastocatellia bacterium]|nr:excinuclease ABC subunit UvrA [Blastocatellia bacterium]